MPAAAARESQTPPGVSARARGGTAGTVLPAAPPVLAGDTARQYSTLLRPYVAVLAFPGTDQVWPDTSRRRFASLLASAASVTNLQHKQPDSKQAAGGAMARRDAWLARQAAEAIIVWDGVDANVGRTVRSFQDHLGEDEVWLVEP